MALLTPQDALRIMEEIEEEYPEEGSDYNKIWCWFTKWEELKKRLEHMRVLR